MNAMKRRNGLLKVITFVLVFCLTISLFTGCSAAEPESAPPPAAEPVEEAGDWDAEEESEAWLFDEPAEWDAQPEERIVTESEESDSPGIAVEDAPASEGNMAPIPIILASETGRQLVYTTDIIIQTTEFMAGQRILNDKVTELGGHSVRTILNGRRYQNPDTLRDTTAFFRLPPENLIELIIFIEDNFNLVFLEKVLTDFTITHERNVTRLDELIEREERLLEELEEEHTARDQRALEQDLESVRSSIRNLESESAQLAYDVELSEVSIHLTEYIPPPPPLEPDELPTFGERLLEVTQDSIVSLVDMLQRFILFLIGALPWLLPLTIVTLATYRYFKKVYLKKEKVKSRPATPTVKTPDIITKKDNGDNA
jgi:hypothetical protein